MTVVSNKVEVISRKNWIDWMKVIGITAVVWGHFFPEGMSDFIYAFNVPVFFVISGYLTKENRGMRENAKKVAVGLMIPYFLLALIKVAGYAFKHISDGKALWSLLFVATGVHDYNGISGCNNLWFVYTLIIIKFFFPIIRKHRGLITILALASLIGGKFYSDLDIAIPWAVPDVLLAFPFFALGYLVKRTATSSNPSETTSPDPSKGVEMDNTMINSREVDRKDNYKNASNKVTYISPPSEGLREVAGESVASFFLIIITFVASYFNGEVHMFSAHYGNNIFLFLLAALSGTGMVYLLSKLLDKVRWIGLRTISSGTIVILTFHRELVHPLTKIFDKMDVGVITQNILIFFSSIVIVLVFIPIIMLLERYAPILLGKRK